MDVKTTADTQRFPGRLLRLSLYHVQDAFYSDGYRGAVR